MAAPTPIEALRTPDERFTNLPGYPYEPHYAEVDGLRLHYLDEHPAGAPVVVLLHGEPSWSYLYRKMIPILTAAGCRVVAPDLVGFGRSDKPVREADYTYRRHVDWIRELLFGHLDLQDIHLFVQDWGGLIGLRLVGEHPERFARVVAANTGLPTGDQPMPEAFLRWQRVSQQMNPFPVGQLIQMATVSALPDAVVRAYEAPFPDERYKAGARIFPALVPTTPDDPASAANRRAWEGLIRFDKPFLTLFSDQDPVTAGGERVLQAKIPGAQEQPHRTIEGGGHFLQEDKGEEIAELLVSFFRG